MNAQEMLNMMPGTLVKAIEANEALAVWLKKGYGLLDIYTSEELLEALLHAMPRLERLVLETIVKRLGCEPFAWSGLESMCLPAMTGAQAKVGFVLLLRKGFLCTMRKSWGENVYAMPEDMAALWQKLLLGVPRFMPAPAAVQGMADGGGICGDIFSLLVYAAKQEIALTQKGVVHKRHLQKLGERLKTPDSALLEAGLAFVYADQYTPSLAVVLDFALRLGLIAATGDRYAVCPDEAGRWIRLTVAEQNEAVYRLWKSAAPCKTALQRHFVYALERLESGMELSLQNIQEWLAEQRIENDAEAAAAAWREWIRVWVRPCVGFGWLELSPADGIRWKNKPDSSGSRDQPEGPALYVQPDFEIIAPPAGSYAVRWELECIGELEKDDRVAVYKLTQESVTFALEQGRTPGQIVDFLAKEALYGVPDNVRTAIETWGERHGKVTLVPATLLRCKDESVARELESYPQLEPLLLEKIGPRDYLVPTERQAELRAILERAGYAASSVSAGMPAGGGDGKLAGRSGAEASERKGLLLQVNKVLPYPIEAQLPDIRDLYPSFQDVPAMWWKDYRSYHPTTRKELAQKAIEWKTALQIRREGSDTLFVPSRVQETRGTWLLYGMSDAGEDEPDRSRETMLTPEQWEEMKLIVPGINDK